MTSGASSSSSPATWCGLPGAPSVSTRTTREHRRHDLDPSPLGSPLAQILISSFANNPPLVGGILPYATVNTPTLLSTDWATYGATGITAYAGPYAPPGRRT